MQRAKSRRQYVLQNDAAIIAAKLPGAKIAKHPAFISPALATPRDKVPTGAKWIHEIKFDGYRIRLFFLGLLPLRRKNSAAWRTS